jgi:hypothetical protein
VERHKISLVDFIVGVEVPALRARIAVLFEVGNGESVVCFHFRGVLDVGIGHFKYLAIRLVEIFEYLATLFFVKVVTGGVSPIPTLNAVAALPIVNIFPNPFHFRF